MKIVLMQIKRMANVSKTRKEEESALENGKSRAMQRENLPELMNNNNIKFICKQRYYLTDKSLQVE